MAKKIGLGAFFCWNCGKKIHVGQKSCPTCGAIYEGAGRYGGQRPLGAGGIGWSDKASDPYFRKYAGKYVLVSVIWLIGLSIIAPVILLKTGEVRPYGEGLRVLITVPAIFWLVGIIFLLKKFGGRDKSWDGVIEEKYTQKKRRVERGKHGGVRTYNYLEYVIAVRRDNGKQSCFTETDNPVKYDYFNVGDQIRNHRKKYVKYIEKYDKTRDAQLFCAACGSLNDARDNYCERCGAPMLKGSPGIPSEPTASAFCEGCGAELTGGSFCESCGRQWR